MPLLLSITRAAEELGISRTVAYELVASGELPTVRIGSTRKVPREALTEYVARLRERGGLDARQSA